MSNAKLNTKKLTGISILTAIVVVLQALCTGFKIGPVSITLTLVPIVVGAAIFGKSAGAFLGGVFGFMVLATDGTAAFLMTQNFIATVALCMVKGIAAGFFAGLVYQLISKKNSLAGVITAAIVAPTVNTGLFVTGMLIFFNGTFNSWASAEGLSLTNYILVGIVGINYVVELLTNVLLGSAITRIISVAKKM